MSANVWYLDILLLDWNETDPFLMLCVKYFSWEIYMQVKKQQLELDMEHQTGSKSVKDYIKAVCGHPAYLPYMQSTSCKMPDGWITNWNQDYQEKYQ